MILLRVKQVREKVRMSNFVPDEVQCFKQIELTEKKLKALELNVTYEFVQ